jgi:hypothetical protein
MVWANAECPVMTQAMLVAKGKNGEDQKEKRLIIGGPPATALTDLATLRGQNGGRLVVVDAASGEVLSQLTMNGLPVFDGMCAAGGRIVVSLTSGTVSAFE